MYKRSVTTETKRIYHWIDPITGNRRDYSIHAPISLTMGKTTHRVTDRTGLVHIVPAVGYFGCVVCCEYKDSSEVPELPVQHSFLKD